MRLFEPKKIGRPACNVVGQGTNGDCGPSVRLQQYKPKCLPCLYYGLEACPLIQSQLRSLEFAVNSAFRKIFSTKSYDVVSDCVITLVVLFRIPYIREKRTF